LFCFGANSVWVPFFKSLSVPLGNFTSFILGFAGWMAGGFNVFEIRRASFIQSPYPLFGCKFFFGFRCKREMRVLFFVYIFYLAFCWREWSIYTELEDWTQMEMEYLLI